MNNFTTKLAILCMLALACCVGCAAPQNGDNGAQAQQSPQEHEGNVMSVQRGVVQHVRDVKVSAGKGSSTVYGSTASTFSRFISNLLSSGSSAKSVREVEAQEITILLDNGQEIMVVQEKDDFFKRGDRIRLLSGRDGTARVQNE